MKHVNFEFKARLKNEARVRSVLAQLKARRVGADLQTDTYFRVARGRLKIREGNLENALIYYRRSNRARPRLSEFDRAPLTRGNGLRAILLKVFEPWVVVKKQREIYFAGNVKIHLDRLKGLGRFVEVEAISSGKDFKTIRRQAAAFKRLFGITSSDLVGESYSDLALREANSGIPKKPRSRRRPAARIRRIAASGKHRRLDC